MARYIDCSAIIGRAIKEQLRCLPFTDCPTDRLLLRSKASTPRSPDIFSKTKNVGGTGNLPKATFGIPCSPDLIFNALKIYEGHCLFLSK